MTDPEKPVPPPDIPKPDIPPPDLPKPEIETPPEKHAPAVAVKVRQPGDPVDDHTPDAGVATFNTRVVAALIDFLVATGLTMAAFIVLPDFLGGLESRVAGLLGGAYLVTRDCLPFLNGRSVGKSAMKLRAVTESGEALTGNWQAGILRNIALLIPFFAIVELVILLTREDKPGRGRRLGDDWARTKVIVEPEPAKPEAD